ncbi:MAG: hypothetical protein WBN18_06355 [Flavobacteriaceae bacterium]
MEHSGNGTAQKQYEISLEWISELSLYRDEMKFLKRLIDRYYLEVVKLENLDEIREEVMQLQDLGHANKALLKELVRFRDRIKGFMDCPDDLLAPEQEMTHTNLQKKMAAFKLRFLSAKQEIFGIANDVLEKMKTQKNNVI